MCANALNIHCAARREARPAQGSYQPLPGHSPGPAPTHASAGPVTGYPVGGAQPSTLPQRPSPSGYQVPNMKFTFYFVYHSLDCLYRYGRKQEKAQPTDKQPLIMMMIPWAVVSYSSPACVSLTAHSASRRVLEQQGTERTSVVSVLIRAITIITIISGVIIMRFQHRCLHAPTGSCALSA